MVNKSFLRPGLPFAVGRAVEEMGELQAALGKTLRWGWLSSDPTLPDLDREDNVDWVLREIVDVARAIENLELEIAKARRDGGLT